MTSLIRFSYLLSIAFLLPVLNSLAQKNELVIPAGGENVIGSLASFQKLQSSGEAEMKIVSVQDQPFSKAIRVRVNETPVNSWELQVSANITGKVDNMDLLLLTFYARSLFGKGELSCVFEKASPEWDKSLLQEVEIGGIWERYALPFHCLDSYFSGEAKLNFQPGSKEQTIEIAEIQLINYGTKKEISALPKKTIFEKKGTPVLAPEEKKEKKGPFERGTLKAFVSSDKNIPSGGFEVVSGISSFELRGKAEIKEVSVTGQSFAKAISVTTHELPDNPWDIQLSAGNQSGVKKEDILLLTFSARSIASKDETGQVFSVAVFEKASPEWDKTLTRAFSAGTEWQRFYIPFTAIQNFRTGEAQLNFHCGVKEQTMEIADISLINYLDTKNMKDLPETKYSYPGMEKDAPWRKEAEARIDKFRKGDISISVSDKSGKPAKNMTVRIYAKACLRIRNGGGCDRTIEE